MSADQLPRARNRNRNGSIDIGPMQLNTDAANSGGFPYIFPGSLTDSQGYFPAPNSAFNGNPLANIMTGAMYLRSLGPYPERYAAPIYRPARAWSRSVELIPLEHRCFQRVADYLQNFDAVCAA
jgi:hypothetical protein